MYNRTDVEVYSKMDMSLSNQHSAIQIHSSCVEKDSTRCKGGAVPLSSHCIAKCQERCFDERDPAQEGEALDGAEGAITVAVPTQLVAPMPPPVDAVPGAIPAVVSVTESTDSDGETSCVSFSTVDIRFYERNLSDNPSVSGGPAIGIGWKFMSMKKKITVNEYEYRRSPFRIYNPEELVIPRCERQLILCEAGYTQTEIADCVRGIIRSKNQRKQTFHNLKFQGMEEFMEKTARRVKRALTLGCQSKNHNVVYSFENEILQQQPVRAS